MKVLLISHTCQSRSEGQPKAMELARLGFDVRVVVPRRWKHYGRWRFPQTPVANAGFALEPMTVRWPWCGPAQSYLHFYPGLGRVLREFSPDIIDLWEEPWSAVSVQACLWRDRLCPQARIVSETEQNVDKTLPPPFEPFRAFVLEKADFLVGRNAEALAIVRRKGFNGPTRVVPNAVDAALFRPLSPAERAAQRRSLGWPEDAFVAGYIGRLVEEKGLCDFLDALFQCQTPVRAVLVGQGPLKAALDQRSFDLNLTQRISILAPRKPSELAPLMGALDVLVLPSRTTARWKEQFGRVLIEAGACGVATIGSDSGAIPEVVGEAGLVFPEGDAAALARCLDELGRDSARAQALGRIGRRMVEERYTWARVAEAMAQIYRELRPDLSP